METTRSEARRLALLACLSFTLGMLVGCGEVTATMIDPPVAASPEAGVQSDSTAPAPGTTDAPTVDVASSIGKDVGPPDAGAAVSPEVAPEVAPPPPRPHCQGAAADYRVTLCKPACGTCGKLGEASTYIAGCWTTDDFHCVDSCGDCR